jgi:hypothetical protein
MVCQHRREIAVETETVARSTVVRYVVAEKLAPATLLPGIT